MVVSIMWINHTNSTASSWSNQTNSTIAPTAAFLTATHASNVRLYVNVICFSVIGVIAVTGNLILNLAAWRIRTDFPPSRYFILSLSWSDFLLGAVLIPCRLKELLDKPEDMLDQSAWCRFTAGLAIMTISVTSWNLVFISVDRFIHVFHPLRYEDILTRKRTLIVIGFLWSSVTLWSFLPFFGLAPKLMYVPKKGTLCIWSVILYISYLRATMFLVVISVCIAIIIHVYIAVTACKQALRIHTETQFTNERNSQMIRTAQLKITKTAGILFGCFLICYTPWIFTGVYSTYRPVTGATYLFVISVSLVYLNSALNCFVYGLRDEEIRTQIKKILKSYKCWR